MPLGTLTEASCERTTDSMLWAKQHTKGDKMSHASDRRFDWVAALALSSGVAVMLPSLVAMAIAILAIIAAWM